MRQLIDAALQTFRGGVRAALHEGRSFLNHVADSQVESKLALQRLFARDKSLAFGFGSGGNLFVEGVDPGLHIGNASVVSRFRLRGILRGTGAGRPTLFRGADGGGFGFGGLKRQADRFGDHGSARFPGK